MPDYWNGENRVPEKGNACVMFIGDSYVIADEFHFT
jgi:hypothetical protein